MKYDNLFLIFGALVISSIIYTKFNKINDKETNKYYIDMISKFLINDTSLANNNKPFLWIHLHNNNTIIPDINSRNWSSFNSRNSKDFNQPYQFLTITSIINKCGKDFNICLIDDNTFNKILPNWNIELNKAAEPIRTHLRYLAIASILQIYGGMFIPSSFICLKSLKPLYNKNTSNNKLFIGEFKNNTLFENKNGVFPNPFLIGCKSNNKTIKEYIKFLEILNSNDFSASVECSGSINYFFKKQYDDGNVNLICSNLLGITNNKNKLVYVEDLISDTHIEFDKDIYGIYIPWDELINRVSLKWFVRLSPEQVLKSNTNIGSYLLKTND